MLARKVRAWSKSELARGQARGELAVHAAENLDGRAHTVAVVVASMRPRLFAAENGSDVRSRIEIRLASMRPRLFAAENAVRPC